jgi:hypothetical protein
MLRKFLTCAAIVLASFSSVFSQDSTKKTMDPPTSPLSTPGMTGPLTINPEPLKFHSKGLGDIYVSGAVSGIMQGQTNTYPGDRDFQLDLSNAQVFVQKVDGIFQFFLQAGTYSLPDLGVPYIRSGNAKNDSVVLGASNLFYGVVPQGFIKIAPTADFSIMAGKLPTLIGAEYTFSFENMNIERGLLWNQENAVNRGVQVNYKKGPVALAVSWNDGFYSNRYNWAWASLTYTVNSTNNLALIGGGNTKITNISTAATPLYQNNEQIYNLIYTHTSGPWTVEPYLQYTHVPNNGTILKTTHDAATYGGALFVNYAFHSNSSDAGFNLPVRVEYIKSSGTAAEGAPNLIYGPGSGAWSFTVTPTYQYKRFFGRAEFSFVNANKITSGTAFGSDGNSSSQARALLEIGMLF